MFERMISLIGLENFKIIENKKILIIGVGGVGGFVAEGLVRSGIKDITIVDKDIIEESNLNRQIIALHSTIAKSKVKVLKERLKDINPNLKINAIQENIQPTTIIDLDLNDYDYIVDACDDVPIKIELIKYALEKNIKLIVATGTARKLHPELLEMTTLDKTSYDPLARKLRESLRDFKTDKVTVLASKERPIINDKSVLGSSAFVPSTGGLLIASYIINDIISN